MRLEASIIFTRSRPQSHFCDQWSPWFQDHVTKEMASSGEENDFHSGFAPQTLHQTTSRVLDVITPSLHSQLIFFTQVPLQKCLNEKCSDDKFQAKCSRTSIFSWRFGLSTREDAKSKWRYIYWPQPLSLCCFFFKGKTHHVLDRSTRLRTVLVKPIALVIKRRLNNHFNKVWNYLCDVIL